jgi:hypothetical protein
VSRQLDILLAIHERIRARIAREESALAARCEQLRAALEACQLDQEVLAKRRWALDETERAYREAEGIDQVMAGIVPEPDDAGNSNSLVTENAGEKKLRARIGPQRYLILDALRLLGPISTDSAVQLTDLTPKRVKEQLSADTEIGVVARSGDLYSLTEVGLDLLTRYEEYKRSKGEPLPSRDSVATDDAPDTALHGDNDEQALETPLS